MQIELKNVEYSFQKHVVLQNVNLNIKEGITAVIGENGAGKSTLLNGLSLVKLPQIGEIFIDGDKVNKKNKNKYQKLNAIVYQFSDLEFFHTQVIDDLLYGIKVKGLDILEAKRDIEEYFKKFNLDKKLLKSSPVSLSGGERKKIAIIGALILKPKLLILDEPTIGLDSKSRKIILSLIKEISSHIQVIIVLHDFNNIYDIANNIIELKDGVVYEYLNKEKYFDLKYAEDEIDKLPELYKVFKKLNLQKSVYKELDTEEKLISYIKENYELY